MWRHQIVPSNLPSRIVYYDIQIDNINDSWYEWYFPILARWSFNTMNNYKIGVQFKEATPNDPIDLTARIDVNVTPEWLITNNECEGEGRRPTVSTAVGGPITMELGNLNYGMLYFRATFMHEMGHILGLAHPGEPGSIEIDGTGGNEPGSSIMQTFTPDCTLHDHTAVPTANDIVALKSFL